MSVGLHVNCLIFGRF